MRQTHLVGLDEDVTVTIHEVFYDANGNVNGWTEEPVHPMGESALGLLDDIKLMLEAFNRPILDYETGEEPE